MHQILLASALAAVSGLFGSAQPSTCSSGQCGGTTYYAPMAPAAAPAMVYQAAPQPVAPVYQAAPAMVQAPQAVNVVPQYQPVYQAPATPLVYYYTPGSTCPGGTCAR